MVMEIIESSLKELKILIVDDSLFRRKVFERMFINMGFTKLFFASDGLDALSQIEKTKTQLVILDRVMPNLNGHETAKQIKKKYPDIVILISSPKFGGKVTDGEIGAYGSIPYPLPSLSQPKEIIEIMNDVIKHLSS